MNARPPTDLRLDGPMLPFVGHLLRQPAEVLDALDEKPQLLRVAPRLLLVTAVGAAVFGFAVGTARGGLQLLYSPLKMPIVLVLPVLLCLPAIRAVYRSCELEVSGSRVAVAALVAMARIAVLAAGFGPVVWLVFSFQPHHHLAVLVMAGALTLAGLPGLALFDDAMPRGGERRGLATLGAFLLLAATTAQIGWLLRPFVGDKDDPVAFSAPLRDDVLGGLRRPVIRR